MNRQLKRELKNCFAQMQPQKKNEFINRLNMPKAARMEFVRTQLGYMHKLGWLLSALILLLVIEFGQVWERSDFDNLRLWNVSAVFPFFALVMVLEGGRSATWGMAELESCTKYRLTDVLFIRMGTLSFFNLAAITAAFILVRQHVTYGMLQTGIYLFFPYLLTCTLTLVIQNYCAGRNVRWYCGMAGIMVSALTLLLPGVMTELFEKKYLNMWMLFVIFLLYNTGKQLYKMKTNMEAGLWNLYLTE